MALDFNNLINQLEGMGLYEVVLPFLLIFTMSYGILSKINLFDKEGNKEVSDRINPIISLVLAFFFVRNGAFVEIVNNFFPKVSLFIIFLFGFLLILALFGKGAGLGDNAFVILLIVSVIFVIWTTYSTFSEAGLPWDIGFNIDWWSVVIIVVIVLVIGGVTGKGKRASLVKKTAEEFKD